MAVTYIQNPRTAGRVIDGTAVVVTPHDQVIRTLNGTGSYVWELAEKPVTLDDVALALEGRFDVDSATARADAAHFLELLCERGILSRSRSSSS